MVGKGSCSKIALKLYTSTEMRWKGKLASLDSTVLKEILLPISFNKLLAGELRTPRVNCNWLEKITAVEVCVFLLLA